MKERRLIFYNVLNTIAFVVLIVVNLLANILPINGITTGGVSDLYPDLFSPAPYTFMIWAVIYLLLAAFIVYQYFVDEGSSTSILIKELTPFFIVSCLANILWLISWHYDMIVLSTAFMVVLLICLIMIMNMIINTTLTNKEKFFIKVPFSLYFGWITVATIANITVMLVSLGFDGFGMPALFASALVVIATIIACLSVFKYGFVCGIAVLWGLIGILAKHLSATGFNGVYTAVVITTIVCILILLSVTLYVVNEKIKEREVA